MEDRQKDDASHDLGIVMVGALLISKAFPEVRDSLFEVLRPVVTEEVLDSYALKLERQELQDDLKSKADSTSMPIEMTKEEYLAILANAWDRADAKTREYFKEKAVFFRDHVGKAAA